MCRHRVNAVSDTAASDMNHDLELINEWAHDWRRSFNPDPQKQAVESIFSKKKTETNHPEISFQQDTRDASCRTQACRNRSRLKVVLFFPY